MCFAVFCRFQLRVSLLLLPLTHCTWIFFTQELRCGTIYIRSNPPILQFTEYRFYLPCASRDIYHTHARWTCVCSHDCGSGSFENSWMMTALVHCCFFRYLTFLCISVCVSDVSDGSVVTHAHLNRNESDHQCYTLVRLSATSSSTQDPNKESRLDLSSRARWKVHAPCD